MNENGKTYSYTLKINVTEKKEAKEKVEAIADFLDECEKKAQKTSSVFRPALLTGIKNIDLLNLSLDRQIAGMLNWSKAVGSIIPLLGKVHKEIEKTKLITCR